MSTVAGRFTAARRTRTKPIISYAESSSDTDLESDHDILHPESEELCPRLIPTLRSRKGCSKRQRRKACDGAKSQSFDGRLVTKKRRQISNPESKTSIVDSRSKNESEIIPVWQSLPYHIFVEIFKFASYPLYDSHTFQPLPSGRWLLNVARMCKAFAEPAFTVLYYSPPLVPMVQAHMLVDLLKIDPMSLTFKYRQKVVSLQIEVDQVAAYILRGSGYLDLYGLVRNLPRLLDLEFYHQKDMSPYRELDATIKWAYPDSIFEALEFVDSTADHQRGDKTTICKLRSWRWSSRLAGLKWPLNRLIEVHMRPSFQSLRKIAFVNYQVPTFEDEEENPNHEGILADALRALPNLEHLIFESSTLLNPTLLPLLPNNLRSLELINCWEIISEDFADFLITHGHQLRNLILNHNQSLNLAFLIVLGSACPNLQTFRMNMTFFNIHTSYRDSEPMYNELLLPNQVPTWPKKLQLIELSQLRKWDTEAAEMFFCSLLNSAPNLLDLRRLSIQAILNVGWRDRASFRDKWMGSLNRVFKRNSKPPKPIYSLHPSAYNTDSPALLTSQSRVAGIFHSLNGVDSLSFQDQIIPKKKSPRRSQRAITRAISSGKYVESSTSESSGSEENQSNNEKKPPPLNKMRRRLIRELRVLRATRGSNLSTLFSSSPETPNGELNFNSKSANENYIDGNNFHFIQGMCESVEIRIDNLRPVENQATEADFLDEEPSGDEDWNSEGDEGQWAFEGINHL